MSCKNIYFDSAESPDFEILKLKLGSMRGIIEMNIDSKTNSVLVSYDDCFVNEEQISRLLNEIGFKKSKNENIKV